MGDHYKIIEKVKELTNGNLCERVIECTGKEWPLNLAGELCAERGKLVIAGFHQGWHATGKRSTLELARTGCDKCP